MVMVGAPQQTTMEGALAEALLEESSPAMPRGLELRAEVVEGATSTSTRTTEDFLFVCPIFDF